MIVREQEDCFIMTTNEEHARLSGQFAHMLSERILAEKEHLEEFRYAVAEHDRGWIRLDEVPVWNDAQHRPFSVFDFPLGLRLPFYQRGIDEVEAQSPYAALLCSMHYSTFKPEALSFVVGGVSPSIHVVLAAEAARQGRIKKALKLDTQSSEDLLNKHLMLLQALDEISLYMCMSKPGDQMDPKQNPYLSGFRKSFGGMAEASIALNWLSPETLQAAPALWTEAFSCKWKRKEVLKSLIAEKGIAAAYAESPLIEVPIHLQ